VSREIKTIKNPAYILHRSMLGVRATSTRLPGEWRSFRTAAATGTQCSASSTCTRKLKIHRPQQVPSRSTSSAFKSRDLRAQSRGGLSVVNSTERDPSLGNGGCAPPDSRDFAIFWPKCFREAATSVNSLQQGHVVVVNVSAIPDLEDQQRAVDFIAGACYALEGQQDALAESIFIFFPRIGVEYDDGRGSVLKHSQAARDALISLARSELKGKL